MYTGLIRNFAQNMDSIFRSNFNSFLKSTHPIFLTRLAAVERFNLELPEAERDLQPDVKQNE